MGIGGTLAPLDSPLAQRGEMRTSARKGARWQHDWQGPGSNPQDPFNTREP